MREAFRNLVVKYLPGCDYARGIEFERKRDKEVYELRTAAAVIKMMLCKGFYCEGNYSEWMCVGVIQAHRNGLLTEKEVQITRDAIEAEIGKDEILSAYMRRNGEMLETVYKKDSYVARIARSVWYWQFINRLMIRACNRSQQVW